VNLVSTMWIIGVEKRHRSRGTVFCTRFVALRTNFRAGPPRRTIVPYLMVRPNSAPTLRQVPPSLFLVGAPAAGNTPSIAIR